MNRYKILYSGGKPKFIIDASESYFKIDVLFFMNVLSLFKNFILFVLAPKKTIPECHLERELGWVNYNDINDTSFIILGEEDTYTKVTIIDKSNKRVIKFLKFKTMYDAKEFKRNISYLYGLKTQQMAKIKNSPFELENIVSIEIDEKDGCILIIESDYVDNLMKITLLDIFTLTSFVERYYNHFKSTGVIHGDFKIYNIRKNMNNVYFLFDLEALTCTVDPERFFNIYVLPYNKNKLFSFSSFLFFCLSRVFLRDKLSSD